MRKKYFITIGILFLILVISILVIVVKKNNTEKEESIYKTEEQMKEIEQKKEELVRLCEEKQEELEAMSKEYLVLIEALGKSKEELTYEDLAEVDKRMKDTKWEVLSDSLNLERYTPDYAGDFEGNVYYRCWRKWGYKLDLIYVDADVEKVLEYVEEYSGYVGEIVKVNEHLYVYLMTFPGV